MSVTQTIEIPASRRITLEIPPEIPVGVTARLEIVWPIQNEIVDKDKSIMQYIGILSPDTYGDGVSYQRKLRDEWND